MKNIIFGLFIFSLLIISSCKRDVALPYIPLLPDTIIYHDIPDTTFTATGPALFGPPYFRCRDSIFNFPLDVNEDGPCDFYLFSRVYFTDFGGPTITNKEDYFCGMVSVNSSDGVYSKALWGPSSISHVDSIGDIINNTLNYNCNSDIYNYDPHYGIYGGNYTNKYLGFKIIRNGKNYFGWVLFSNVVNRITFKAWAINKTAGNSIVAGQTH
jgi:hypothetical protein